MTDRGADLPAGVRRMAERGEDWADFVAGLPAVRNALVEEWDLRLDGAAAHGYCSLVVPVRQGRVRAMLKIAFADDESEHEHLALQRWGGRGAVRLLRADPRRRAMLLERLDPVNLMDEWDVTACEVVAGLYRTLHVRAMPQLRSLSSYVERWVADLAALPRSAPLPRRMVEQAVSTARDLLAEPDVDARVIHADLHYENVLRRGDDWVAIDPKPVNGDPHYEVAPMLWDRFEELSLPGSVGVREGLRQRFFTLVDTAELDEDRAKAWVLVRMMCNALWWVQDPPEVRRQSPADWLTRCLTVAKAVQD